MQGEFRADVTRDTFDELKQIRRVLFQQGRVLLDADVNQQVSILLNYIEKLAADIIGPHGGPGEEGFKISTGTPGDPLIGIGRYYVDGILCENNRERCHYTDQPDYKTDALKDGTYLLYLDVFEQHQPGNLDAALQGVDTTAQARLVWQVKARKVKDNITTIQNINPKGLPEQDKLVLWEIARRSFLTDSELKKFTDEVQALASPKIKASVPEGSTPSSHCEIAPESRYRGPENQLYRVEIHRSGKVGRATFKWSRENSSVSFPVVGLITKGTNPTTVAVAHLGRDNRLSLTNGDWVELITEDSRRSGDSGQLMQVLRIDRDELRVTLNGASTHSVGDAVLVRWDHQSLQQEKGEIPVKEDESLILEDGITIEFVKPSASASWYRAGDYWLIPARVATGDVEWSKENGEPKEQPPHGVLHHYAPLAFVNTSGEGLPTDLRKKVEALAKKY